MLGRYASYASTPHYYIKTNKRVRHCYETEQFAFIPGLYEHFNNEHLVIANVTSVQG